MKTYKVYDKVTKFYVGTIEIDNVRKYEKDFILIEETKKERKRVRN